MAGKRNRRAGQGGRGKARRRRAAQDPGAVVRDATPHPTPGLWRLLPLVVAAPLTLLAWTNHAVFWPDEVFQTLEQAHRFAFGYGFVPWEFDEGARSWLFPGALGMLWKAMAGLGVDRAETLLGVAKLSMAACTVVAVYLAMRLAGKLAGDRAALLAGLLSVCYPLLLVFGFRAMTEVPSATLVIAAAWFAVGGDADEGSRRRMLLAGLLAGAAVFLRYQNGLFLVGLALLLLARRRLRDAMFFVAAAALVGVAGGVLDWVTWGAPFHAFRRYLTYNLLEGRSHAYGVFPPLFYATTLWSSSGLVLATVVATGMLGAFFWRARGLVLIALGYLLAHSFVAHKELRFVYPVLPLMLSVGAAGLVLLADELARRWRARPLSLHAIGAAGVVLAVLGGWRASQLTQLEMGQHPARPQVQVSPWRVTADVNRLLLAAGEGEGLCGLAMVGTSPIWSGGYSYLHRDVPLYPIDPRTLVEGGVGWRQASAGSNYLIARQDFVELVRGWQVVTTRGSWVLLHRAGACGPPPRGFTRIFPRG